MSFHNQSVKMFRLNFNESDLPKLFQNEIIQWNDIVIIRSNVKCMEEIKEWINEFGRNTKTAWNTRNSRPHGTRMVCKKLFVCQHSSFMKVRNRKDERKSKDANCSATISVKIRLNTRSTRARDPLMKRGLCCFITMDCIHTHDVHTAEILRFLPPDENMKKRFMEYFDSGMGVADSCNYHRKILELQDSCTEETLANGQQNPIERRVRYWFAEWKTASSGFELTDKLKEKQNTYEKQGVSITYNETPFAVLIVTPLMKRAHKLETSHHTVFVYSARAYDSKRHCATFFLTSCPAGTACLGVTITKGKSEEAFAQGYKLFQNTVDYGKQYPKIFVTKGSQAEISALQTVWPQSKCYFCIFHVLQTVWRWLWNTKNSIPKNDRLVLMKEFVKILYSSTEYEAKEALKNAMESSKKFPKFQICLTEYWKTKELWCLAWRDSNAFVHSNSFSDISMRIFKDVVIDGVKPYNVIAMIDFVCSTLEDYYCNRFHQFANDHTSTHKLFLQSVINKTAYLRKDEIIKNENEENEYLVPSESDKSVSYIVNIEFGLCSCKEGIYGKFCKHQCAIYKYFGGVDINLPPITSEDRLCVAQLTLGGKIPTFQGPVILEVISLSNKTASPSNDNFHAIASSALKNNTVPEVACNSYSSDLDENNTVSKVTSNSSSSNIDENNTASKVTSNSSSSNIDENNTAFKVTSNSSSSNIDENNTASKVTSNSSSSNIHENNAASKVTSNSSSSNIDENNIIPKITYNSDVDKNDTVSEVGCNSSPLNVNEKNTAPEVAYTSFSSSNDENLCTKGNIDDICSFLKQLDLKFGSSSSGIQKLKQRLGNIVSAEQWESFLHAAGNNPALQLEDDAKMQTSLTAVKLSRGSKRPPTGHLANCGTACKKRVLELSRNYQQNCS